MTEQVISVRRLEEADAEAYRTLRLEALAVSPESFASTFEAESAEPLEWFAERLQRNAVFGAFRAADLVGIAGFFAHAGAKQRHKGVLWGMYVRPAASGVGIGRLLGESVIEHARRQVELLQLQVVSTNEPALRLYAGLGFTRYGLDRRGLKDRDRYFDEVLMVKVLDE